MYRLFAMECDIYVYNLKPEKEDHIPRADSPISADNIDNTSFFSILRMTVDDPAS